MEKLIENWGKKNPEWEIKYEDTIIKRYTDYGRGAGKLGEDKGMRFISLPSSLDSILTRGSLW